MTAKRTATDPPRSKRAVIEGSAYLLKCVVDCDAIIPVKYCVRPTQDILKKKCLTAVDPDFPSKAKQGLVILAGRNFGRGSANENAVRALMLNGVKAVIAESIARIFYRNAVNLGLPALVCPGIIRESAEGDRLRIELDAGICANLTRQRNYAFQPLTKIGMDILLSRGLVAYLKKNDPAGLLQAQSDIKSPDESHIEAGNGI